MSQLQPFQREFVAGAMTPGVDTACLTLPRGNGKSWLAGRICAEHLWPDSKDFQAGSEIVLIGGSIEQCRTVYRFVRALLEPIGGDEFRYLDSATRCAITHAPTGTRLRVAGSNAKTAMGLVGVPLVVADEPGAWELRGGELMYDAIQTAMGKPGSALRAIYIGTLAPFGVEGHWWHTLATGKGDADYTMSLQGDVERWDDEAEILRVNPLTAISDTFRAKLLKERDAALSDERLKPRFLSYRLNVPTGDQSSVLITVDDWERVLARDVGDREGLPAVGVDLGGGRAWSAAVALWPSGRVEALALAPGIPSIEAQEKRDRVPRGTYAQLVESGALTVAEGLRVPPVADLVDAIRTRWEPRAIVCDRFRLAELEDTVPGCPLEPRVSRWSESSFDIRSLRKLASDGPLSVDPESVPLLEASLSAATVKVDESGNTRLVKRGSNNQSRDDVAAALVLACGFEARSPAPVGPMILRAVDVA